MTTKTIGDKMHGTLDGLAGSLEKLKALMDYKPNPREITKFALEDALKDTRLEDRGISLEEVADAITQVFDGAEIEALINELNSNV